MTSFGMLVVVLHSNAQVVAYAMMILWGFCHCFDAAGLVWVNAIDIVSNPVLVHGPPENTSASLSGLAP